MNTVIKQEISRMSIDEKILLVEDLWDSIALSNKDLPLSAAQVQELKNREENFKKNPSSAVSWEALKAELKSYFSTQRRKS